MTKSYDPQGDAGMDGVQEQFRGQKIECVYCDGYGIRQNGNVFDPCPEECSWCAGNGHQWQYPGGAIAAYYGGPLMGRSLKSES